MMLPARESNLRKARGEKAAATKDMAMTYWGRLVSVRESSGLIIKSMAREAERRRDPLSRRNIAARGRTV
jgi:hypothetical protein